LDETSRVRRFEQIFAAHLDAAYDFARWLTRDDRNAEDVVQEACLRAFRSLDGFHGDNGRAWLLTIVRNTYYTWLKKMRPERLNVSFDDDTTSAAGLDELESALGTVDQALQQEPEQLAHESSARYGYPPGFLARYFEKLHYSFGPRERAGLMSFLELARDVGELAEVPELRFVTSRAAV